MNAWQTNPKGRLRGGYIFLCTFLFLCSRAFFLSGKMTGENDLWERFFYSCSWVIPILEACWKIPHVLFKLLFSSNPLSDFLRITLLLRDNPLRAWRSPVDILSFGLSNSILASSNFTSSRKVSRATDGWTPGAGLIVPSPTSRGKEWGSFSSPWNNSVVAFVSQIDWNPREADAW